MKKDEIFEKNIEGSFDEIELKISFSNTTVTVSETDSAYVKYIAGGNNREISAEIANGVLAIIDKGKPFSFGKNPSTLSITLPAREYDSFRIKSAAGMLDISGLTCGSFTSSVASGNAKYDVFADNIAIKTASGNCELNNCTDRKAQKLTIDSASGKHNVSGFSAENFEIVSASGSINIDGISGRGEIHSASGNINLNYSEWDRDLEIDIKSGKVNITLPEGSGVKLDMDAMSGSVNSMLNGENSKFSRECQCTFGGENTHHVKANLLSGSINFLN